jgi:REP element-mobilizing transposase RayT
MPRPQRIQFGDAFYHVINRGKARSTIFHDERYYQAFLKTLEESYSRFDAVFHAYCLMGNHYHLLIETPRANLSRIMRHINGVYTQRYNRLRKTDGPLFRGRYKAILVDKDEYLLQLSRYIHRNPVETKKAMVSKLEDYPWSSYPIYINQQKSHDWLRRDDIYAMLGMRNKYAGYKSYVEAGNKEDISQFYSRGNTVSVIGSQSFRKNIAENKEELKINNELSRILNERPTANDIVKAVSKVTGVSEDELTRKTRVRRNRNDARKLAIYLSQQVGDLSLKEISQAFDLSEAGVSYVVAAMKTLFKQDRKWESLSEQALRVLNYIQLNCP